MTSRGAARNMAALILANGGGLDAGLKRGDRNLLFRVWHTNGGGVEVQGDGDYWLVPQAQLNRLLALGLIRWKPGHPNFIIHTDKTREVLGV